MRMIRAVKDGKRHEELDSLAGETKTRDRREMCSVLAVDSDDFVRAGWKAPTAQHSQAQ